MSDYTCDDCKNKVKNDDDFDGYYCPYCGSKDVDYWYNDDCPDHDGGYDEYGTIISCHKCKREYRIEEA